jgi:hypothetical protein
MSIEVEVTVGMRPQLRHQDQGVAEVAGRQHGVITHQQLLEVGFSRAGIQRRLRAGRLHRLHRGIYAVGHKALPKLGRLMAAVLACGPDALLSHHSSSGLWALRMTRRRLIDVTALRRNHAGRSGISVHLVDEIHPDDRAVVHGIPVTSVARTLLDLAGVVNKEALARAIEQAERLQLFDLRAIDAVIARSQGRRGVRALRRALVDYREPPHLTRSELERRFLDLCRDAGFPLPAMNVWVAGQEVDVMWEEERLAVELDGRSFHQTRAAFERDRLRDAALQLAGYRVLRVTRRRLETEPAAVVAAIRALLATRLWHSR